MEIKTLFVGDTDVGKRLDVFLSNELEDISRSRIKSLIENGDVLINNKPVTKSGISIKKGEIYTVNIEEPQILSAIPQDLPIDIIYQDADLAVINKAQGMVTHPATGTPDGTLVNAIMYKIGDLSSINGVIRPGIVHRLDKDTSGLIVIAKNDKSHVSLASQIGEKSAKRYYRALVDGNIKDDTGIIEAPIARHKTDRKKMAVSPDGRFAKTFFKVLERFGQYTYVEYELFTGRTHQIRVHSSYIHHPVVGDAIYGGSNKFKLSGQLLHAYKLVLDQPSTGERMVFTSPLPNYFEEVLEKLRKTTKF